MFEKTFLILLIATAAVLASIKEENAAVDGGGGRDSLYDPKDQILETFGRDEFDRLVYNRSKAFFVQFYSAWCGHCRHFAPIFKQFVKRIAPWSKFVSPVAVNCGSDRNFEFCRRHNIASYPTLKYFNFRSSNELDGRQLAEDNRDDVEHLTARLAKWMALEALNSTPDGWPLLRMENWDRNRDDIVARKSTILLIVPASFFKQESILSIIYQTLLDFDQKIDIRLIDSTQNLARRFFKNEDFLPGLIIFGENKKSQPIFVSKSKLNAQEIRRIINEQTNMVVVNSDSKILTPETTTTTTLIENFNSTGRLFVHKLDLLSALWHILYRDAAKFPVLDRPKLEAMKEFLEVVLKYFPSNKKEKQFLFNLLDWLNGLPSDSDLDSKIWISKLDTIQQQTGHPLPEKEKFVACRGSTSKFRGFTCSVWMLFHTITVNAYKIDGNAAGFSPRKIIFSFKRYVTDIFGCAECGKHFRGETADLASEVREPRDVVLYLWKVHNNVNKRLKGQKSEDPFYPKEQFPPARLCRQCFDEKSGQFNENFVLEFLLNFYSKIQIDFESDSDFEAKLSGGRAWNPKFDALGNQKARTNGGPSAGAFFDSFDAGICLALWLACAFLNFW